MVDLKNLYINQVSKFNVPLPNLNQYPGRDTCSCVTPVRQHDWDCTPQPVFLTVMQAGIPWIPWTKKPWRRRRPHPLAKHAVDGLFDANIFNVNGGCKAEKFQDKCVMVWNCLSCLIENILKEWPHKVSNKLYKYVYHPNCSKSSVLNLIPRYSEYPFQKKLRKKRKTKPQNACICTAESEALHLRLEPPRNPRQILWSKWIQWGGMKGKKDSYEKILSYLQWFWT